MLRQIRKLREVARDIEVGPEAVIGTALAEWCGQDLGFP